MNHLLGLARGKKAIDNLIDFVKEKESLENLRNNKIRIDF